jgi:hypothetical protein
MSRPFSVDNDFETRRVNWMLEDFPEWLKQKCKEQALSERKTLKAFVIEKLQLACGDKLEK